LAEAVAAFRLEQQARGVSPHTLRAQDGDLEKLLTHAAGNAWKW
jgi:integrase/recombinase XerC